MMEIAIVNETKKMKKKKIKDKTEYIYQCSNFCSTILNMLKLNVGRNNET